MNKRQIRDEFFDKAKREGYVARSAYKLLQIQEAKKILRKGGRALDLGCAPGGWLQAGAKIVGKKGEIVGVDITPITSPMPPNTRSITGDAFGLTDETLDELGAPFDCVLSDMAPSTTGHGDHELSVRLCRRVLEILPRALKPGGSMAIKVFEGAEYPELLRDCKALFKNCKGYKPKASRDVSVEMYIVGTGYTGQ
jgi:23S rRNA (uridine2552-2'-O)-methyltransferase